MIVVFIIKKYIRLLLFFLEVFVDVSDLEGDFRWWYCIIVGKDKVKKEIKGNRKSIKY